jgi:hypothetical protein
VLQVIGPGGPYWGDATGLRFQARADASDRRQARPSWDFAAELLLKAAEMREEEDIEAATAQMERALRVEGWL